MILIKRSFSFRAPFFTVTNPLKIIACSRSLSSTSASSREIIHKKVKVRDVNINYVEMDGNPDHVVFCMPGSLSSIELDFIPLLQKLNPRKFKAVAWDPPGYGRSRPPDRDFSGHVTGRDADYALDLMKELGHKKYSILGWSMGGLSAYAMASKSPDNVKKLVTWGTSGYWDEHSSNLCKLLQQMGVDAMPKPRLDQLYEAYGEEYTKKLFYDWIATGDLTTEATGFTKDGPATTEGLRKIQCPTLLIHGSKDKFIADGQLEYLNKNIKNSRAVVVENGSHGVHSGKTEDEFLKIVEEFLSDGEGYEANKFYF